MRNTVDKKCYGLALYVGFKKAFDTVDHAILLDKLDRLGFRGKFHLLLKDYLSKRYQYVVTNGKQSKMLEIKYLDLSFFFYILMIFLIFLELVRWPFSQMTQQF